MEKGRPKSLLTGSLCGMLLCLISSLILSLGTMMVANMKDYHPITKSFYRFLFTFLPGILVAAYYGFKSGSSIFEVLWPITSKAGMMVHVSLLLRSIFGCTAGTLQYYSLKYIPLGDSSVICNSYPVFVAILARLFLGEPFGYYLFFSTLVTLSGVIVVTQPPFLTGEEVNVEQIIGACLAFGCSICLAFAIVMIRHLKKIHHSITLVFFGGWGTVESLILTLGFGVLEFPKFEVENIELYMMVAIGLLSCLSQMFLIFALKCDNAGPVSLVKTTDVMFAFIWQLIFFHQNPSTWSMVGALIMMLGIALAGLNKYVDSLSEWSDLRQKLWFVLK